MAEPILPTRNVFPPTIPKHWWEMDFKSIELRNDTWLWMAGDTPMTVSKIIPCPNCGTQMMSGDGCTECPHFDQPGACTCAYCRPELQIPNEEPITETLTTVKQTVALQNLRTYIASATGFMERVSEDLVNTCVHVDSALSPNAPTDEELAKCPICDVRSKAERIGEELSSLSYRVSAYVERGNKR